MKKLILCAALAVACGKEKLAVTVERAECENLNPLHCMMPWPSSRYLVADEGTITKRRMRIPAAAMPKNQWDEQIDSAPYERFDGFSPMTSMITVFDGELDTSNLPGEDKIEQSVLASSPTILLDAETGKLVGHFSEINEWDGTDFAKAAFYVRPAQRLEENRHYIVAIRDLKKKDGTAVAPSDYFRALRDDLETELPELEARRASFEELFAKLAAAGIERSTLIQAWDFHTASGETAWRDLVAMRDDALARVGAEGLGCTVNKVEEDFGDRHTYRRVTGTFTVPLYLENDKPGARILRDADGRPKHNGTAEAPFYLTIPWSVKNRIEAGGAGARLLTYGHGLMGSGNELNSSFGRRFLHDYEIVGVATDWWGMASPDTNNVANALGELGKFPTVAERLTQGVLNTLLVTRSFAGACARLPVMQIAGRSVIDPSERYYLGISQGSIMGTTVSALSTDIERFILNVGGISYPTMIIRSVDFPDYNRVIQAWYKQKLDTDLMMVMIASFWDLAEPASYAPHILRGTLPGSPAKKVLYTIGRYDAEVPNVASDIAARTMGLPYLEPSVYVPWNLPKVSAPAESAYVIYDVGAGPVPLGSKAAAEDNVAHSGVRQNAAAQRQMDAFMRKDGRVQHFCSGPCDPD